VLRCLVRHNRGYFVRGLCERTPEGETKLRSQDPPFVVGIHDGVVDSACRVSIDASSLLPERGEAYPSINVTAIVARWMEMKGMK